MGNLQLDYDEEIIIESEDVYWSSRDYLDLSNFSSYK